MIIKLFLGSSGSGKTTYIEKNILEGKEKQDTMRDNLKMCVAGDIILFGHYNCDRRCKGCDTLSMSAINDIIKMLGKLIKENNYSQIILDGDRVNNKKMLEFLLSFKDIVEIYFIDTDLEIIYERLPECNKVFVKTTQTKTRNMIIKFATEQFKITRIETRKKSKWF